MKLSVVIANYNYEQYVGLAIESALAIEGADVEVLVVDDGSTDGSRALLDGYADRVTVLTMANGGQRKAVNAAYPMTTGDVVVFLDADDLLPPNVAREVEAVWGPTVSKVQFKVRPIDASGRTLAGAYPAFAPPPTPQQVRSWFLATTAYPSSPASGNAYSRWFLDRIFPLDDSIGPMADGYCIAAAPLLGDVVTAPDVVVGYRWHASNSSNLVADPRKFAREVLKARNRWLFAQRSAGAEPSQIDEAPLRRSRELLQFRISALRLAGDIPSGLPGDTARAMLVDVLRSPFHPGPESWSKRVAIAVWSLLMLFAPLPVARRLVARRYRRTVTTPSGEVT